jgi:hypothetical protein
MLMRMITSHEERSLLAACTELLASLLLAAQYSRLQ